MKWAIALDVALYLAAVILFFNGLGILSLICVLAAGVLTFILLGVSDGFSWFMLFDGITDIFD